MHIVLDNILEYKSISQIAKLAEQQENYNFMSIELKMYLYRKTLEATQRSG